jgi:REP element-mobilizing transposase RayT
MRTARAKIEGAAYYHVMNRILERRYILKDEVAEKFRSLMRQVEAFTGVQVVTYCLMTNHVHLLLRVPQRQELTDPEILARLEKVSSPAAFAQFMDLWNRMLEQKSEAGLQELRQSVLKRMFDISFFMKELKQRFTQWYNRRAKRNGTLWQDRFKSTLIENKPGYLATAAAYIDNNPVRARLVKDPKDYRFCGYAAALAGDRAAQAGLAKVIEAYGVFGPADQVLPRYRMLLFGKGLETPEKAGYSHEERDAVFTAQGELQPWTLAKHRLRWLSDGAVIGSKAFVAEMRTRLREKLRLKRAAGEYPAEESEQVCALRFQRAEPTLGR